MSLQTEDVVALIKKHPVGCGCGLLAVLLALALYFRGSEIPDLETQLEEQTRIGQRQQLNITNGALLDEQLAEVEAILAEINDRVVDRGALANNLQYFYQLVAESGVKIIDLRPDSPVVPKAGANYAEASFSIAVEGTYGQILAFLKSVESGRRFAWIDTARFGLAAGAASGVLRGDPVLSLNMNVKLLGKS